ncbi:hypothetical protein SO802_028901 [Lithocarpus litseifolius]|uniref:Uncharacterized protein n=1 Tax=Lithocarpus litseifolius TaxID=425828 RepID=A0AAW2BS32_9ROSI
MVDYSFVRADSPSVSFLFACLGCLLEIVEGERFKGFSLFVGEDCPYRFILSSLLPLVSRSARVARFLKMSREVRSSELETGLSSFDDCEVLEVTSPSTPNKAWNIQCALLERDEKQIRDRFQFPDSNDVDAGALKAHEALSMDDLSPLMEKSSSEVMSSHIQKLLHVYFDNVGFGGVLVHLWEASGLEKKVATTKLMIKYLSAENETLRNKVANLIVEAKNEKECVAALDKSLQVEKDFCKLMDKQIDGATAMQEFKDIDSYLDELCEYYVEGFKLFRKWMVKHHPGLDLSSLVIGEVEKELFVDHPSEATVKNVMEEATTIAEVIEEAATITPVDPAPNEQ